MVRAPCCEKMGLKKGPWTAEEDQILIDYIDRHGHGNWRALPKQAGLLRCGKSCRLRWMNYLRPDIKRGNFTMEEEEAIISLHEKLGNRWSAIAARLPGRTDNEIKNVWHTHLKKRLTRRDAAPQETKKKKKTTRRQPAKAAAKVQSVKPLESLHVVKAADSGDASRLTSASVSPAQSCSEFSSSCATTTTTTNSYSFSGVTTVDAGAKDESFTSEELLEIDESFWADALCMDDSATSCMEFSTPEAPRQAVAAPWSSFCASNDDDDVEFWMNVFMEAGGGLQELPSF